MATGGVPEVLSAALVRPTPWEYTAFNAVQFGNRWSTGAGAVGGGGLVTGEGAVVGGPEVAGGAVVGGVVGDVAGACTGVWSGVGL